MDVRDFSYKTVSNRILPHLTKATPSIGFFYDNAAKEQQVMFAGSKGIEAYSVKDDIWRVISSRIFIYDSIVIQESPNYFLSFGGHFGRGISADVYQFDENGISVIAEGLLSHRVQNAAVIPVDTWPSHCEN